MSGDLKLPKLFIIYSYNLPRELLCPSVVQILLVPTGADDG